MPPLADGDGEQELAGQSTTATSSAGTLSACIDREISTSPSFTSSSSSLTVNDKEQLLSASNSSSVHQPFFDFSPVLDHGGRMKAALRATLATGLFSCDWQGR